METRTPRRRVGEFSGIAGISTGADGNLWFTENDTDHVGALTPDGTVVELFDVGARPLGVILGPDGNLWFTEADGNAIGRVNVAPRGASFVLSLAAGFAPRLRRAALGDLLQWTFFGPGVHSVVDTTGLGLFDSGPRPIVSTFVLELTAAGRYFYRDGTPPHATGVLAVALDVPESGTVGAPFSVDWATRAPGGGRVFDVQVRVPGAANFSPWLLGTEATGAEYTPEQPGRYRFRSRMRDPESGANLRYSPPAAVAVWGAAGRRAGRARRRELGGSPP